jgi:4-hydroxy-2-oxoheptanedioate aldolase
MQDFLTTTDIQKIIRSGKTKIQVGQKPIMTDLASEMAKREGIEFVVTENPEPVSAVPASAGPGSAPAARPSSGGGYGGGGALGDLTTRKTFREFLKDHPKPIIGTFIGTPHPVVTEFVGHLGFDFVTIDTEHNAMHLETVQKMLQGLSACNTYGMVRVPSITYEAISGTLDIGADAILVPQIRTVEDIMKIKMFSQYPPVGRRGAGPGRAVIYGNTIGKLGENIDTGAGIVVQLETVQAVQSIDAILEASEDFVDIFFIGPGDLSMDMGIFGQFSNPKLVDTIMMLRKRTRAAGKKLGIFAGSFDAACNWIEKGFDMVIVNSELALMGAAISAGLSQVKEKIGG